MKEFNNIEEMKKYYDKEKNLFYIKDDIKINFDLVCDWNITAWDIKAENIATWDINARNIDAGDIHAGDINAWDINAGDIKAGDINARNIEAMDISFWAVCFAYKDIKCTSIKGGIANNKYFALDGGLVVKGEEVG